MATRTHPAWKPKANGIYIFRVNDVPHVICGDCIDVAYVNAVSDAGIGTSAYGTCEMCGFQKSSVTNA